MLQVDMHDPNAQTSITRLEESQKICKDSGNPWYFQPQASTRFIKKLYNFTMFIFLGINFFWFI